MTTHQRSIDYTGFLSLIEREAGVSRSDAERAARATLQTLGERLSSGQARDIADQLPPELGEVLANDSNAQPLDAEEFVRRFAQREDTDVVTAERHARAVFAALGRAVTPDELADMASELPKDFAQLLANAQPTPAEQAGRPPA